MAHVALTSIPPPAVVILFVVQHAPCSTSLDELLAPGASHILQLRSAGCSESSSACAAADNSMLFCVLLFSDQGIGGDGNGKTQQGSSSLETELSDTVALLGEDSGEDSELRDEVSEDREESEETAEAGVAEGGVQMISVYTVSES